MVHLDWRWHLLRLADPSDGELWQDSFEHVQVCAVCSFALTRARDLLTKVVGAPVASQGPAQAPNIYASAAPITMRPSDYVT